MWSLLLWVTFGLLASSRSEHHAEDPIGSASVEAQQFKSHAPADHEYLTVPELSSPVEEEHTPDPTEVDKHAEPAATASTHEDSAPEAATSEQADHATDSPVVHATDAPAVPSLAPGDHEVKAMATAAEAHGEVEEMHLSATQATHTGLTEDHHSLGEGNVTSAIGTTNHTVPVIEIEEPTGSGMIPNPTEEATTAPQHATDAAEPATDAPQHATDAAELATDAPQHATDAPQHATEAAEPATEAEAPATEAPVIEVAAPAQDAVQPGVADGTKAEQPKGRMSPVDSEPPAETEAKKSSNWWIVGVIVAVLAVGLATFYVAKRRSWCGKQQTLMITAKDGSEGNGAASSSVASARAEEREQEMVTLMNKEKLQENGNNTEEFTVITLEESPDKEQL